MSLSSMNGIMKPLLEHATKLASKDKNAKKKAEVKMKLKGSVKVKRG